MSIHIICFHQEIRKEATYMYFVGNITRTRLYSFDPLKPHFYIEKLGSTGVFIIVLILLKNIDCGYSLDQSMFWEKNMKNIRKISKNFLFLVVKFSIYLNRRVFVMTYPMGHCVLLNCVYMNRYDLAQKNDLVRFVFRACKHSFLHFSTYLVGICMYMFCHCDIDEHAKFTPLAHKHA